MDDPLLCLVPLLMSGERVPALPCPFCASTKLAMTAHTDDFMNTWKRTNYYVSCEACGTRGPIAETDERAVAFWNTRNT